MSAPQLTERPRHAEIESSVRSRHVLEDAPPRETLPANLPKVGFVAVSLFTIAFLSLLAGLFVLGYRPRMAQHARAQQQANAVAESLPVVSVAQPRRPTKATEIVLPANLQAFQQTGVYARANGYLRRLHVDIGDTVQADQLLAELDTPEIDAQLGQSRATAQQAEASVEKAAVDLKLAESTLHRYDDVAKAGAVAQQELDERRTQVDQARAGLNVARANLEAARAQVRQLEVLQSFARITAPFAGVVTARNYDPGALLSPNTASAKPLFQMEQIETLRVFVNVPHAYSNSIQPGQSADLRVSNYPGRAFQGQLVRSAGSIDSSTRTLRVEIHVPNHDRELYGGMYGQVKLKLTNANQAWVVPASALVYNADGLSLALVDNGTVHYQPIKAGRDFGKEIEVLEGLSGGETVITNPGEHIREGSQVQTVAATTQPERGKPSSQK